MTPSKTALFRFLSPFRRGGGVGVNEGWPRRAIMSLVIVGVGSLAVPWPVDAFGEGVCVPDALLDAIERVESGGDPGAVGDGGKALGAYQIWACVVADVNEWTGDNFTHGEMFDREKARYVCRAYLERWGAHYERMTGRSMSAAMLARIWVGGPNGWKKRATLPYWKKVEKAMTEIADVREGE